MFASVAGLLRHLGVVGTIRHCRRRGHARTNVSPRSPWSVTAASSNFAFVQPYRGCDIIARRNTLIALDGETEIRTPHDDCLLIMPSLRPSRGHTAVRLARFVTA